MEQKQVDMNNIIYPPSLKLNDKAVIISPSGSTDHRLIDNAKYVLEGWGLNVSVAANAYNTFGRFGGTVVERYSDIQEALNDGAVRLIFCSRGGYGAVQLLESIDMTKVVMSPKWLVGYSDITALHQLMYKHGIVSLHGPMARHLLDDPSDASICSLRDILFSNQCSYTVNSHELNVPGMVEGCLIGGNLSVFTSLLGTPYFQIPKGSILFLEDIAEAPYKINRMMWQLKLAGVLERISGLIIGQFTDYEEDIQMQGTVYELILEMVLVYGYPVSFGFPVGHTKENLPLLHGAKICFHVDKDQVVLTNSL